MKLKALLKEGNLTAFRVDEGEFGNRTVKGSGLRDKYKSNVEDVWAKENDIENDLVLFGVQAYAGGGKGKLSRVLKSYANAIKKLQKYK